MTGVHKFMHSTTVNTAFYYLFFIYLYYLFIFTLKLLRIKVFLKTDVFKNNLPVLNNTFIW